MMLLCLICLLLSNYVVNTQGYCRRADGIYNVTDGGFACLQSLTYDVNNCCFVCAIQNGTNGTNARCGSLFNFNVNLCEQSTTVIEQVKLLCGGTDFKCLCTTGSDTSELFGTPLPTTVAPSATTNRPTFRITNDTASLTTNIMVLMAISFIVWVILDR